MKKEITLTRPCRLHQRDKSLKLSSKDKLEIGVVLCIEVENHKFYIGDEDGYYSIGYECHSCNAIHELWLPDITVSAKYSPFVYLNAVTPILNNFIGDKFLSPWFGIDNQ